MVADYSVHLASSMASTRVSNLSATKTKSKSHHVLSGVVLIACWVWRQLGSDSIWGRKLKHHFWPEFCKKWKQHFFDATNKVISCYFLIKVMYVESKFLAASAQIDPNPCYFSSSLLHHLKIFSDDNQWLPIMSPHVFIHNMC